LEVAVISFKPRYACRNELTHEGVDILYVTSGEVVLRVDEVD